MQVNKSFVLFALLLLSAIAVSKLPEADPQEEQPRERSLRRSDEELERIQKRSDSLRLLQHDSPATHVPEPPKSGYHIPI
jgi:hypothetical protein